jgi:hypothetical protein
MTRFISYGTCSLCGKNTSKAAMARHLKVCPPDHDLSEGKISRLFHLRIEDAHSPYFWLDVEIKAGATLLELDRFLRAIWLECCGHLSSFDIDGVSYSVPYYGGPLDDDRSMDAKLYSVLAPGGKRFEHTYDFGTSTDLKLRLANEREGRIGGGPLRLLSRNDPPVWSCEVCERPAIQICAYCMYEQYNPFYCEVHAEEHGCEEEALLPVVNSPRMGMCGYTGPA